MKQKGLEPRILYPARLSFKFEGGIKQFPDKQKLREFASHKPPPTGYFRGTALDGSTPKKSTEQNTQHMKNGGGGIRRERRKESPDSSISELS